jgi:nucleoid-associated protein YgaU
VVYACYPDLDAVRLILNVQSIAVHFEKSLVQELLPALSSEMKLAPAELVPSLLNESEAAGASSGAVPYKESQTKPDVFTRGSDQAAEALPVPEPEMPADDSEAASVGQGLAGDDHAARRNEETEHIEPLPQAPIVQEQVSTVLPEEEASIDAVVEQAAAGVPEVSAREPIGDEAASAYTEAVDEKGPKPEDALPEQILPVPAEAAAETPEEEEEQPSSVAGPEASEETPPPFAAETSQSLPEAVPGSGAGQGLEFESEPERGSPAEHQAVAAVHEQTPEGDRGLKEEQTRREEPVSSSLARSQSQPVAPVIPDEKRGTPGTRRRSRRLMYAVIAAVLAVLVFIVSAIDTSDKTRQVGETAASKAESSVTVPEPTQHAEKRMPERPLSRPSLVLEIPAERYVQRDVYVVVKDDTLWNISERFTGNPFNYPKIAGENRIADPDLIFPGQRIRLKKKE